ncbi:MAG: CehA/McbA family metallohydrolase [Phycisphaerae bacterium]|nr:CehA/McbA family metallohydrolase [Phycisphaerae bacterium]
MKENRFQQIIVSSVLLGMMLVCLPALGADTGEVSVTIREAGAQAPLPCRVWMTVGNERLFSPSTESCTSYARDRSFSCDGQFVMKVPVGKAVIRVERGKEYWPVDKEIVVEKGLTAEVEITLKRWVHMSKEGWYSGDIHCHFGLNDLKVLRQLALADDVNFEPILTLWNHQSPMPPGGVWPDWSGGSSVYADATHLVTLRNQEIERIGGGAFESVGALLMMGLTRPVKMPPRGSRYPCDAALGRIARETCPQCIIDTDKPIWGENVVGVALGLFDSVQVCHNHYHREQTLQDGRLGWGMADVANGQNDTDRDELFHRTNSTYYRFLNCGFKLAATGGSAMGVMAVPLGYGRTYASLDGPLSEAGYLSAIRAGRTFATNGPILILTADGADSGAEIQYSMSGNEPIWIKADLRSIQRIDLLELVYNGKVIKRVNLDDETPSPVLRESASMGLKPLRSGWVAARATFASPDGHLRQAHTSPVYILVDDKPIASKNDAEYMIRWVDRLIEVSNKPGRYNSDEQRIQTQAIFKEARSVYENIAQKAANVWGDS